MFYPVDDLRDRHRSALSPRCGNPNISTCKGRSRTFFAFSQGPEGLVCRTAGRAFHLYFGQYVDNDYVRTKFLAERAILEARIEKGLDAVILRAGNLMGRYSDGEFQINFITNGFLRSLRGYKTVEAFDQGFKVTDAIFDELVKRAGEKGIKGTEEQQLVARREADILLKAYIARNLFDDEGFYPIYAPMDEILQRAIEELKTSAQ